MREEMMVEHGVPVCDVTVFFGDVHGESRQLDRLIKDVRKTYEGYSLRLVTVGDLIDRGPDVRGVLDLCVEHGVTGVFGNHETWLMGVLGQDDDTPVHPFVTSKIMGGAATLRSYGLDPKHATGAHVRAAVPEAHQAWLGGLQPFEWVRTSGGGWWLVTHAGINAHDVKRVTAQVGLPIMPEGIPDVFAQACPDQLVWGSPDVRGKSGGLHIFPEGVTQVFGHLVQRDVVQAPHFVALDTGCGTCPPKVLSALVVEPDGNTRLIQAR